MLGDFAYMHLPLDRFRPIYRKYACAAFDIFNKFDNSEEALKLLLKKRDTEIALSELSDGAVIH